MIEQHKVSRSDDEHFLGLLVDRVRVRALLGQHLVLLHVDVVG